MGRNKEKDMKMIAFVIALSSLSIVLALTDIRDELRKRNKIEEEKVKQLTSEK